MTVSREETQARLDKLASGVMKHTPEQSYTVADRFEEHAQNIPDACFLIYEDQQISYGELNEQANRYADMAKKQGLQYGDAAAVMIENRPEFFYAWLGLAKLGVIAALINTEAKGKALQHALDTTNSKLLFLGAECIAKVQSSDAVRARIDDHELEVFVIPDGGKDKLAPRISAMDIRDHLSDADIANPDKALRKDVVGIYPLFYVFTSGTTGLPKAAILSHMRWLGVGDGWATLLGITAEDVFYCVLPLFHGAAGMSLVSNAVSAGASVVVRRRFSATRFWDDIRQYGITTVQYIGEIGRYLINQPAQENDKEHTLKYMTGAGLTPDVWKKFLGRFGDINIYEGWGSTEANCNMMNMDGVIGSCGRIPFKDRANGRLVKYDIETDTYPKDENGFLIECEAGEIGEWIGMILEIPGLAAGRFEGYTDEEATEKKILHDVFSEGDAWYSSGDLFTRDEDDYFYFVDRIGDTYRWKSENVSTTEVTEALGAYEAAEMINIYGIEVPGHEGRAGMAAIQLKPDMEFDPQTFYRLAEENLAAYALPQFIRVSDSSDLTTTFKLRKVDLQKQGFDLEQISEPLYVIDRQLETYLPFTEELVAKL